MTAALIDGKYVSSLYRQEIKETVALSVRQGVRPPGLAVILIGEDSASTIYVNSKRKACKEVGFNSYAYNLPVHTTEEELLTLIEMLNEKEEVDGILVQFPLPKHIDSKKIIERILPTKDVDGFHPYNIGRLAQGNPLLRPCTPYGIMKLLEHYHLPIEGRYAVVIGASNIVGRPMALELLMAKATVTICHRKTKNLEHLVRPADIIVVATGVRHIVHPDWLNSKQIIIDVGMHRLQNGSLCGDVDFNAAKDKVAWITPVPFGVGPMTICMLLQNTLYCAQSQNEAF